MFLSSLLLNRCVSSLMIEFMSKFVIEVFNGVTYNMSKKKSTKKGSSNSNKKKPKMEEEIDLNEYKDSYNGKGEAKSEVDYDEYELPEDFVPETKEEVDDSELPWTQRQIKKLRDLDNYQRLYWIKILLGCITGVGLGFGGAQTGWWLLLMIGLYAGVTAGGYFLFKLEWNFKEVIFSGFFPYLALFVLFWVLMFSSLYGPPMNVWFNSLKVVITETINGTEHVYTSYKTTAAAGFPFYSIILTILGSIGLLQFILRYQRRKQEK